MRLSQMTIGPSVEHTDTTQHTLRIDYSDGSSYTSYPRKLAHIARFIRIAKMLHGAGVVGVWMNGKRVLNCSTNRYYVAKD